MIIDDLVILGRACPEPLKDGRITVCLGGWSDKHGFIRLYPTRYDISCHQWDTIKVDVEQNERDSRAESWKIAGSKKEWETLSDKIQVVGSVSTPNARRNIAGNLSDKSVPYINGQHRSLGIVKPHVLKYYFAQNPRYGELFQRGLPGFTELEDVKVKRDFPFEPRITYTCPEGDEPDKQHDQQVLEWGFYEWLRKEPEKKEQVWKNAGFDNSERDIYFFVGNQAAHRNSFLIISVLRFPKGPVAKSMFPLKRWSGENSQSTEIPDTE